MIRRRCPCSLPSAANTALFHSTPPLDRRRGSHWNPRFNVYTRRLRRMQEKQALLRDVSKYAEYLFKKWRYDDDDDDRDTSSRPSWYEHEYWARATRRNEFNRQRGQWDMYRNRRKGRFQFCDSDDEGEEKGFTGFWSSSRVGQGFYWSFQETCYSGSERGRDSSYRRHKTYKDEDEDEDEEVGLASERRALGLSTSGPLKLREVKEAFRACALRWHPDRHVGSSKGEAEEKFKNCLAAYQSLCEKIAVS